MKGKTHKKYLTPFCEITLFSEVESLFIISAKVENTDGIVGGDNWIDFGDLFGGKK